MDTEVKDYQVEELAQKMYDEDCGQGNLYRQPDNITQRYENKALAIIEGTNRRIQQELKSI